MPRLNPSIPVSDDGQRARSKTYRPLSPTADRGSGGRVVLAGVLVMSLLLLTAVSATSMWRANQEADYQRFKNLEEKLCGEIRRQVNVYNYGLMGTRSVFVGSNSVDRGEFRKLISSRDVANEFPAATGMGYIDRVMADDLDTYLAEVRADGAPDFAIRMLAEEITHDDLFVIKYIEPAEHNGPAVGLDIGQESRRRAAAERAMREGVVSLTAQITLVQATGDGPGFLILLPYYDDSMPTDTPEQREAALVGWVYMTILAERVFDEIEALIDHELDFRVFDSEELSREKMLYAGGHGDDFEMDADLLFAKHRFHEVVPVEIGGREWMVAVGAAPEFHAASNVGVWLAGAGGVTLSVLLGLMLHIQGSSLQKARAIAASMTIDLRRAALTDRLTNLPNRAAILDKVQDAISRAQRVENYHYAVLFLDFDRFKIINDSLGHSAGDLLLQEIGSRLRSALRPHDSAGLGSERNTAARLGGDEFIVLLDGMTRPEDALIVAERLLEVLAQRYVLNGRSVGSTASIGVVLGDAEYATADEVIRDADTAMYEAKAAGRGGYKVFDHAMRDRVNERLDIENEMAQALERGQFTLHYQPILALDSGTIESFEALVRWEHPGRGTIGPDRFIPVAEDTGFIVPLGQWVLETAIDQYARWRDEGVITPDCRVNVNLSRKQLVLPNLFDDVTRALRERGVEPARLHLEVTESQIMQDPRAAIANLQKLRRVGVVIDIDDFGTGYSSLACLHEFPVDVLKIDRAFVANVVKDPGLTTVLRTVAELAANLGVKVVAEGIETREQHELLASLGCEFGQGYLFSKPLPAAAVPVFCAANKKTQRGAA
ncbi:MAG: EAL domain-containing protein [Planctomycetota bacterium]